MGLYKRTFFPFAQAHIKITEADHQVGQNCPFLPLKEKNKKWMDGCLFDLILKKW